MSWWPAKLVASPQWRPSWRHPHSGGQAVGILTLATHTPHFPMLKRVVQAASELQAAELTTAAGSLLSGSAASASRPCAGTATFM